MPGGVKQHGSNNTNMTMNTDAQTKTQIKNNDKGAKDFDKIDESKERLDTSKANAKQGDTFRKAAFDMIT